MVSDPLMVYLRNVGLGLGSVGVTMCVYMASDFRVCVYNYTVCIRVCTVCVYLYTCVCVLLTIFINCRLAS